VDGLAEDLSEPARPAEPLVSAAPETVEGFVDELFAEPDPLAASAPAPEPSMFELLELDAEGRTPESAAPAETTPVEIPAPATTPPVIGSETPPRLLPPA